MRPVTDQLVIPDDLENASAMIHDVFMEFMAPDYTEEGVENFLDYITPEALARRQRENHFALVARIGARIAGIVELQDHQHVSLLFVDKDFHLQGIARSLFTAALGRCLTERPGLYRLTVNSSPFAVMAYRRLGFIQNRAQQTVDGITFVPMVYEISEERRLAF